MHDDHFSATFANNIEHLGVFAQGSDIVDNIGPCSQRLPGNLSLAGIYGDGNIREGSDRFNYRDDSFKLIG